MDADVKTAGIDTKEVGRTIRWYRRAFDLSQRDFAKRIGSSFGSVNLWERGINKGLKLENLTKIANFFGVSEQDLLHPSDEVKKWINMSLKKA